MFQINTTKSIDFIWFLNYRPYICCRNRSLFTYPERLRERPEDVLATCETAQMRLNKVLIPAL